jgi:hypothetical protein
MRVLAMDQLTGCSNRRRPAAAAPATLRRASSSDKKGATIATDLSSEHDVDRMGPDRGTSLGFPAITCTYGRCPGAYISATPLPFAIPSMVLRVSLVCSVFQRAAPVIADSLATSSSMSSRACLQYSSAQPSRLPSSFQSSSARVRMRCSTVSAFK